MKSKKVYTVNVGNIGNIEFSNKKDAIKAYFEYVGQSMSNYGRAAGEDVILFDEDNVIKEYIGTLSQSEQD